MLAYRARKRSMVTWSAAVGVAFGIAAFRLSPLVALSVIVGLMGGLANALLSMRSNERLIEHRRVGAFVFVSLLRVFVFGIVPVEFATRGPWWIIGTYFVGFFTPLALYAICVARELRTS
jgi:hypothetical protein